MSLLDEGHRRELSKESLDFSEIVDSCVIAQAVHEIQTYRYESLLSAHDRVLEKSY